MSNPVVKISRTVEKYLTKGILGALVLFFVFLLCVSTLQIVLRTFFHTGIYNGDVASRQLTIWVGFLGAILAASDGRHFHIDVITRFLSARGKRIFDSLSNLFAVVACYFLTQASISFMETALEADAMVVPHVPARLAALIVPVCFGCMSFIYLLRLIDSVGSIFSGEEAAR